MTAVAKVMRNTPPHRLRDYFVARGLEMILATTTGGAVLRSTTAALLRAMEMFGETDQAILNADFERIQEMTDEAGQWAILHAPGGDQGRQTLRNLSNPHERAMWLFLNDPERFRRAEEVRYTDTRRQGRMWSGFVGPRQLVASRDPASVAQFEERVRTLFGSRNAKLDLFERSRIGRDNRTEQVVQAVIYRDGLPDAGLEFNALGELELHLRRPVFEVAITYDPASGVIEVVAQGVEHRARLARLFAEVILRQGILGLRIPLRQFDLSRLLTPCDFPSDPEDGIEAVKVTSLKLRPQEPEPVNLELNADWRSRHTVHELARQWLIAGNVLQEHFEAVEATISVRLRPTRGSGRRRTVNVTISLPNGCSLKSKTEKERQICDKYLPRWGVVKDV